MDSSAPTICDPAHQDLAAAARTVLVAGGESWTEMRALVFDVIAAMDRPASAYAITDAVGRRRGRTVAANSIYRILEIFMAHNLVRRVESANAYIVNTHPGAVHDCIFLMCDRCGQAVHIDDDGLASAVRGAAADAGFAALRPVIEVRGWCAQCQ